MSAIPLSSEQVMLLQKENAELRSLTATLAATVAELKAQLALMKQKYFGGGQSETLDKAQLPLAIEQAKAAEPVRPVEKITYERPAGPAPKRTLPAETFAHLPVKETIEIIPEAVQKNPTLYIKIGEERTIEIDIAQPQIIKREIRRPKYKHVLNRSLAPGGFASAGLIAWVLTAPSTPITSRSTARRKCSPAGAHRSPAKISATGSAWPRRSSNRWSNS